MKEWSNEHIDAYSMTVKDWLDKLTDDNWHTERMVIEAIIDGDYNTMKKAIVVWIGHMMYGYMPDELTSLRKKIYEEIDKEER